MFCHDFGSNAFLAFFSPDPVNSVKSNASDVSYFSNPSWIAGNNVKEKDKPFDRIKRIRRPQTFDNKTLQIDLGAKKGKTCCSLLKFSNHFYI